MEHQMPAFSPLSPDVKRHQAFGNVIARLRSGSVRSRFPKLRWRGSKYWHRHAPALHRNALRSIGECPECRLLRQAPDGRAIGGRPSSVTIAVRRSSGYRFIGYCRKVLAQCFSRGEFSITPRLNFGDADSDGISQCLKASCVLSLLLLDEPQPVPDHLAGVLVTAGIDQACNQVCLKVGQHNIARRHSSYPV